MGSSGLHSNGYSLARQVLLDIARMPLDGHVEEFGHTLGEELLVPTRIYARDCLALAAETDVRTFAHITGGGLARNLERVLPAGLQAVVDRNSWTPAPVFNLIATRGRVQRAEMEKTFNMGDRHGRRAAAPTTSTARWPCSPPGTSRPGCSARCSAAPPSRPRAPAPASCSAATIPGSDRARRGPARRGRMSGCERYGDCRRNLVHRLRTRGRSAAVRAVRLTGAAVAAFLVADLVGLDDPPPIIAALTALIVVQVTLTGTLVSGLQRVLSVLAGVLIALGFVSVVGLSWWSLGLLVGASIVVGQLLRLGPQLVEAPISAMLVLGVGYAGGAEMVALERVLETLVGAAVGLAVNLVVPPAVASRFAGQALQRLADEIAGLLDAAAVEIPKGLHPDVAGRWLEDARRLNRHVPRVDRALAHAEESAQLNLRALTKRDRGLGLRDGLEALEHCSVTVRSLFRAVYDASVHTLDAGPTEADRQRRQQLRRTQGELVGKIGVAVRAFGTMLGAEVDGRNPEPEEARLSTALWALRAARADATELLLRTSHEAASEWDLNSDLAQAVDRLLIELDVGEHTRTRDELRQARAAARERLTHVGPLGLLRHPGRGHRAARRDVVADSSAARGGSVQG